MNLSIVPCSWLTERTTSSRWRETRSSRVWVGSSSDRVEKFSRSENMMVRKRLWPPSCIFWSLCSSSLTRPIGTKAANDLTAAIEGVDRPRQHGDLAHLRAHHRQRL